MDLEELCRRIELPEEVREIVLNIGPDIPPDILKAITARKSAEVSYQKMKRLCKPDRDGLDMLSYMLRAALGAYEIYREMGIEEEVFIDTMKCFSRFVKEHKASFGYYGFDRGFWTYRQLSMALFRLGELEYELPEGEGEIHLHIPSDANIELPSCKSSLEGFHLFTRKHYPEMDTYPIVVESWLLSPALREMLPPKSKIIQFQKCFEIESWDKEETEFLQWVYGRKDIGLNELPTDTTLQRKMKEYLLQGKKVGGARGRLKGFPPISHTRE